MTALRVRQIEEALADLEAAFADPQCFRSPGSSDPRPVQDYALSLASEFVGAYRDDEVRSRLAKLIEAEDAGSPKDALRNLNYVRRKLAIRLEEWGAQTATKPQVAITHDSPQGHETLTAA